MDGTAVLSCTKGIGIFVFGCIYKYRGNFMKKRFMLLMSGFSVLMALLFFNSCRTAPSEAVPAEVVRLDPAGEGQERWRGLNSYSAVSTVYRGLFSRFGLSEGLTTDEKWKVLEGIYFLNEFIPREEEGIGALPLSSIHIDGFFQSGDPLMLVTVWIGGTGERIEWMSNCIHSPVAGGPLLGKGAFIGNQGDIYNYDDALYIKGGRVVRAADLDPALRVREQNPGNEEVAAVMIGQALLYGEAPVDQFQQISGHLKLIGNRWAATGEDLAFAALLVLAEWEMAMGNFLSAEAGLDRIAKERALEDDPRRLLIRRSREVLELSMRFEKRRQERLR
jgi:hypothetical protein